MGLVTDRNSGPVRVPVDFWVIRSGPVLRQNTGPDFLIKNRDSAFKNPKTVVTFLGTLMPLLRLTMAIWAHFLPVWAHFSDHVSLTSREVAIWAHFLPVWAHFSDHVSLTSREVAIWAHFLPVWAHFSDHVSRDVMRGGNLGPFSASLGPFLLQVKITCHSYIKTCFCPIAAVDNFLLTVH